MPAHFTLADSRAAGLPEILQGEQNLYVPGFPREACPSTPLQSRNRAATGASGLLQWAGHQIRLIAGRATPWCRQSAHRRKPAVATKGIHLGVHIENRQCG